MDKIRVKRQTLFRLPFEDYVDGHILTAHFAATPRDTCDIFGARGNWSLTHIPTGMCVSTEVRSLKRLRYIAKKLEQLEDVCWDGTEPGYARLLAPDSMDKIRKICMGS